MAGLQEKVIGHSGLVRLAVQMTHDAAAAMSFWLGLDLLVGSA